MGALRGMTRIIDFVKIALIARILTQASFGLFAIVTTVVGTLEALTQTGVNFAVIHYKLPIAKIYKTLWIINAIRGILLMIIVFLSAALIASFYRSDELYTLLIISSLVPLFKGLQNPATVVFYQKLDLRKEFVFKAVPSIIGAFISIYFAFVTKSALGLVYGLVATSMLETLFSYIVTKNYFFESKFEIKYLKKILGYTKWLTFGSVFSFLINQVDNLFVGRFFNLATLGLYDLAFKLASITYTEITDIISRVLFPTLAKVKSDKKRMQSAYIKTTLFLFIPATIVTLLFLLFPAQILLLSFGDQWISAAPLLQILSIYGFIRTVNGPIGPLFLNLGKTKLLSLTDTLNFFLLIILLVPFSTHWGINGVAWAIVVSYILVQPPQLFHLYKYLRS